MQLNLPPDLETLINKRLSSCAYTNAEAFLCLLRFERMAQDVKNIRSGERRENITAHPRGERPSRQFSFIA
jgi:hypothetical protein